MAYVLGIDIGGTATTAAVARRRGDGWSPPEPTRLGVRSHAVPSVLHLAADGALTVGDPVRPDPGRTARGFVRRIGDDVPLMVGGEPCTPQALTAVLAMWVVERVQAAEGAAAEQVVLSHPAVWGRYRRALLRRALADIGLADVTLLPEPVVAAESHAGLGWTGGTLAVYSLGGNDFEASVVRRAVRSGFRVLRSAAGVEQFGGVDVDEALTEHVLAALGTRHRELRGSGPQARLARFELRPECARAKERLTGAPETEVVAALPHGQVPVPVSRADLEELIRPAVQVTVDTLARMVRASGLHPDQLDGVLLVGGAARMPLVAELVAAELPGPVTVEPRPRQAAAAGAALAAGKITAPPEPPAPAPVAPVVVSSRPEPDGFEVDDGTDGEPPPRPPVKITPLQLTRPGRHLFGLVGGRP